MFNTFFLSKRWRLWAWGGLSLILSLIYLDVQLVVWFNSWYKEFYDLLQKPTDINLFWKQIEGFTIVATISIFVETISRFIESHWMFRWREAMTQDLLPRWLASTTNIEGASQRLQEDTLKFTRLVEHLGEHAVRALLIMIAFTPILWELSKHVSLPIVGVVPGILVILAVLLSFGALAISWLVGIKLPGLEYNNQKAEASYRKALVLSEDKRDNYPPTFFGLFQNVKNNYVKMFLHYSYFNTWKYSYEQFNIILPYLLMAPSLFSGAITLGIIIQTGNSFEKVSKASSFIIQEWSAVTELRSVYRRLKEFEKSLEN